MKRLVAVLAVLLISTAVFADIIIQQDFEGVGITTEIIGDNLKTTLGNRAGSEFTPSYGLSFTALYEFNSDETKPVHYQAGLTTGVDGPGFTVLATGGLSAGLAQVGQYTIDLRTELRAGLCMGLENLLIPMIQTDVMIDFMKADRKGLYGSIGLADHIQNISFPALAFDDAHIISYFGLIFAAGWRF